MVSITVQSVKDLIGSPTRDLFKWRHKQSDVPRWFYACDIDFLLVEKGRGIIAALDYKTDLRWDYITFTECLAYNDLITKGIRVFVVEGRFNVTWTECRCCGHKEPKCDAACGPNSNGLTIWEYKGGNWKPDPPTVELERVACGLDMQGFIDWEKQLRRTTG